MQVQALPPPTNKEEEGGKEESYQPKESTNHNTIEFYFTDILDDGLLHGSWMGMGCVDSVNDSFLDRHGYKYFCR